MVGVYGKPRIGGFVMANSTNFLEMLSMLEDTFEFNKDGKKKDYSQETILVYRNLKNFIVGCSWTDNPHYKFIVENKSLKSEELAVKYSSVTQGKQKAAATFRVQRAEVCKILSSIFGNNINNVFYTENKEGLKEIEQKVALLSNGVADIQDLFPEFILADMKKHSVARKFVKVEDCSKEIIVLSRLTTDYIQKELASLDPDKIAYIYSLLNSDIIKTIDGKHLINKERLQLLSELNAYSMQQQKIAELQTRVNELQHENNELKRKHKFDKKQVGLLVSENSKLKQVVELYEEYEEVAPQGSEFIAMKISDDDLCDDTFLDGGTQ